jgi:hypothetical protein
VDRHRIKAKQVAPGIWEDGNGDPHFDCVALCRMMDIEPTPENVEKCMEIVREAVRASIPSPIIICDYGKGQTGGCPGTGKN